MKNENTKITLVIGKLDSGGAAKIFTHVANLAVDSFDEVSVITLSNDTPVYHLKKSIRLRQLGMDLSPGGFSQYFERGRHLRAAFKQDMPTHVFAFVSPIILYAALATPFHVPLYGSDRGNPEAMPTKVRWMSKILYNRCRSIVFQSEGAARCYGGKIERQSVVLSNPYIPNGNDPGVYKGERTNRIVCVGRMASEKRQDILLQAFAKSGALKTHRLAFYGDGDQLATVQHLAKSLGIADHVDFHGDVREIMEEIQDAAVYVLPSDQEGMPNSLIEAMALGLPCISTNCMPGNTNTLIQDGANGLVVEKNNVESMANAIDFLVNNPEKAQMMGKNAAMIRETLSIETTNQKWKDFFVRMKQGK